MERSCKAEREKRKLTQQEVADALGINRRMITRYENGISFPRTKDAYRKIAEYFKVDVNYLLTEDEEFVVQASEQYGSRGMKQAKDLIEGMSGLFAGRYAVRAGQGCGDEGVAGYILGIQSPECCRNTRRRNTRRPRRTQLGIHLHFLDNLNDLLGMYTPAQSC